MHETDLPCSDCGTDLVERSVATGDAGNEPDAAPAVTVAECPACGARYYPERALSRLSARPKTGARGDD